jgi:uncharacterized membrane protein HdeD (DUF308 family)
MHARWRGLPIPLGGATVNLMADMNQNRSETNYNRLLAMVLGWVLLLVGVIGFIPGITTNGPGPTTGHGTPPAQALGLFEVNVVHSLVHTLSGIFLLIGAYAAGGINARMYNIILGVVYLVVFLAGFVPAIADALAINAMDAGLHIVLGVVLLAVPFLVKETMPGTRRRAMTR